MGLTFSSDLPQRKPAGPMVAHHSDHALLEAVLHDPLKYPVAIGTEGKKGDPVAERSEAAEMVAARRRYLLASVDHGANVP